MFITVEGCEGSGKTTQLAYLSTYLENQGFGVVITREPGGTLIGENIRGLLLDQESSNMSITTELLLMFAARAEHLDKVIRPALMSGYLVLCERFTDSTYAYQGGGRGLRLSNITNLEELVQCGLQPNLTLLLDLPVEIGLERVKKRGVTDRFEQEKLDFFIKVRAIYLKLALLYPERYRVINANQSLSEVHAEVVSYISQLL